MNQEQLRQLALAGTVSFPATFPRLAEISVRPFDNGLLLVATEQSSPRVTIRRCTPITDVRAIFVPHDLNSVNHGNGDWLIGKEVLSGVQIFIKRGRPLYGIVYVAEQTSTLLEVSAGMTAAESAQYYPPLPVDRSVNHYDPYRGCKSPQAISPTLCEGAIGGHAYGDLGVVAPSPCEGLGGAPAPQPCEGVEAVYQTIRAPRPIPCEGVR